MARVESKTRTKSFDTVLPGDAGRLWESFGLPKQRLVPIEDMLTFLNRLGPFSVVWEPPWWSVYLLDYAAGGVVRDRVFARALWTACRIQGALVIGESVVPPTAFPRFSDRVALAAARARIGTVTLAQLLGTSYCLVAQWMRRVTPPPNVAEFARVLNVSEAWLRGEGDDAEVFGKSAVAIRLGRKPGIVEKKPRKKRLPAPGPRGWKRR